MQETFEVASDLPLLASKGWPHIQTVVHVPTECPLYYATLLFLFSNIDGTLGACVSTLSCVRQSAVSSVGTGSTQAAEVVNTRPRSGHLMSGVIISTLSPSAGPQPGTKAEVLISTIRLRTVMTFRCGLSESECGVYLAYTTTWHGRVVEVKLTLTIVPPRVRAEVSLPP